MTINKDEIQEYFNSDDGKAVFEELLKNEIANKGYKAPEEITGLSNKNRELLAEIAKKNEKIKKSDEKYLTILQKHGIMDVEDLDNFLSTSPQKKTESEEINRKLQRLERELEAERKSKADYETALKQQKEKFFNAEKQTAILKALSAVGVDESATDVLSVYFDRLAKVEEDETGNLSILADDGVQSKSLIDYVSEWSKTDKAKNYIKATSNAGAGTVGSKLQSKAKMTREQIAQLPDRAERYKAMKENGYLE